MATDQTSRERPESPFRGWSRSPRSRGAACRSRALTTASRHSRARRRLMETIPRGLHHPGGHRRCPRWRRCWSLWHGWCSATCQQLRARPTGSRGAVGSWRTSWTLCGRPPYAYRYLSCPVIIIRFHSLCLRHRLLKSFAMFELLLC